ncbi:hypothetical protein K0B96_05745 [Horticoccus luteus]|uniref:Acetoacetate decarboxylase n=1 Tax=Horticoccus luteus TaxID=2862869 RepID=A0A8F9TYD1_9BACT|nr:hypothetical protein [Horticoccus luteus]QYM80119.1 hypothetical protein K0B96_05745 [Horticoccus luteus]
MAFFLRHLALRGSLFLAVAVAAIAQPARPRELEVHFTVFAPTFVSDLAYRIKTERAVKLVPLTFFPTARSPVYAYRGPAPLEIVDEKSGEVVALADVPPNISEPLIILFPLTPAPTKGTRFRVYVHDDAKSKHGPGGLGVLNFSNLSLDGTVDRQAVQFGNGFYGPYNVGAVAKVMLRTRFRGRSLQTYADSIHLGRDGRALLLLLPPFYRGSLEVQTRILLDEVTHPDSR